MRNQAIKLPFGLRDGRLVHISQVDSGLACACVCPACHGMLVARKGALRTDHFAHKADGNCSTALETALHLAAKEILLRSGRIALPAARANYYGAGHTTIACAQQVYKFDSVQSERRLGQIVADLVAYIDGEPLIIEVKVTHAVDAEKMHKIRSLGISALEIDLASCVDDLSFATLASVVVEGYDAKRWLYNSKAESMWAELVASGVQKVAVKRGIAYRVAPCPIAARTTKGQPYADFELDCIRCQHLITSEGRTRLLCNGHNRAAPLPQLALFE